MKTATIALAALMLVTASRALARDPVAAAVNGKKIRRSEVHKRLWRIQGRKVLDDLIWRELIEQEAAKLKIKADAKEVDRRVRAIEAQLPKGTTLKEALKPSGLSIKELRSDIEFAVLREALVVKSANIQVSQEEIRAVFEANRSKLGTPEARRLRHIMVKTQREAEDLLVAVRAGADFAKLAVAKSLDVGTKEKGGDLGFVANGVLRPEIESAVSKLRNGETSPIIKSSQGFHIFQAVETRTAVPAKFKDVKNDLLRALLAQKINAAYPKLIQSLESKATIKRY